MISVGRRPDLLSFQASIPAHFSAVVDTPGQTRPDNLGPLGRRVHRAKTHGRWRVEQVAPGCYPWRSPEGFVYLVTPSLSLELHDPTKGGPPQAPPVMRLTWADVPSTA